VAKAYDYIVVGGGVAGSAGVDGVRAVDPAGRVLLLGDEPYRPYNRPPLTKGLWFGKTTDDTLFSHPEAYWAQQEVDHVFGMPATAVDAEAQTVTDAAGNVYGYRALLLATGGTPRRPNLPGADLPGLFYYRYLADYYRLRSLAVPGARAVVVGGGFIGSEIAAALQTAGVAVTILFPETHLASRVFPEGLGRALQEGYRARGVRILAEDLPTAFAKHDDAYLVYTRNGETLAADIVIVGIGIAPHVDLARDAGLAVENGITVNEYLQTSHPAIYSAGDVANFPYAALGTRTRVEHWDHAVSSGTQAGRNMAGAGEAYTHMPYFYSDLFEFGYEAVGEVDTRLPTVADWTQEYGTGVIYYLRDDTVRGVMLCNVWGKLDDARALIRAGERVTPDRLRGRIV
jgi:NADPH-dependent 2,4-dienoyl-CoA reductase/sulfur reductase-like enzyme